MSITRRKIGLRLKEGNIRRNRISSSRRMIAPISSLSPGVPYKDAFNRARGKFIKIGREVMNKGSATKYLGRKSKQCMFG